MFLLALLLQSAAPPTAVPVSPQGEEMVALFTSLCSEAALSSAPAHQLLDGHPDTARPMTSDELGRVMPGTTATDGWITQSPHGAWGALWFAPEKKSCGVTVRAGDPTGMEAALDGRLRRFYAGLGLLVAQGPDETLSEGGTTVHRASWTISAGMHELAVIASFADKPIGAHQHLMTFTMLH